MRLMLVLHQKVQLLISSSVHFIRAVENNFAADLNCSSMFIFFRNLKE